MWWHTASSSIDPVKKELKTLEHKFISSINKVFVENITAEIKNLKENYVSQMKGFLLEANLSLCLENRRKLTVPVAGNYKLFVTLSVKGHIYPGEDIASIKLSNSSISGGEWLILAKRPVYSWEICSRISMTVISMLIQRERGSSSSI